MAKRKIFGVPNLIIGMLVLLMVVFIGRLNISEDWVAIFGVETLTPPLKVGTNVWPGYEPLFLARELGYFEKTPIRLVEYVSATQVIRAYRNNAIQVAALTLDEVLLLLENGLDPCVVLVVDFSNGGDAILARPDIKNLEELRGRRVGVENTALGGFFLNLALSKVSLSLPDVEIIASDVDEHERMFLDGKIDAVVTFEPVRSRLIAKGAHQIFDSSQVPGEIVDVLVIAKKSLERFPDEVEKLLEVWFKALEYFKAHPAEAASLMSKRLQISPEMVLASFDGLLIPNQKENLKLMTGKELPLKETATKLSEFMLNNKLLLKQVVLTDFICPMPVEVIKVSPVNGPDN